MIWIIVFQTRSARRHNITKTCLYNSDPLTSTHNICFEQKYEKISELLSENIYLLLFLFIYLFILFIYFFFLFVFFLCFFFLVFMVVKFSIYLNRRVFLMKSLCYNSGKKSPTLSTILCRYFFFFFFFWRCFLLISCACIWAVVVLFVIFLCPGFKSLLSLLIVSY